MPMVECLKGDNTRRGATGWLLQGTCRTKRKHSHGGAQRVHRQGDSDTRKRFSDSSRQVSFWVRVNSAGVFRGFGCSCISPRLQRSLGRPALPSPDVSNVAKPSGTWLLTSPSPGLSISKRHCQSIEMYCYEKQTTPLSHRASRITSPRVLTRLPSVAFALANTQ